MSIVDKSATISANNVTIAENEQKVYDAGYNNGYSDMDLKFWKMFTYNGIRDVYNNAFAYTDFSNYNIPITIIPKKTAGAYKMFYAYRGKYLPSGIDLSELDLSNGTVNYGVSQMCAWGYLTIFPDLGLQAPVDYYQMFANNSRIQTIEVMRVKKATKFTSTFSSCTALANVTFEGEIGQNLSMSACTKLTHDSLMNIIEHLYDYSTDTSGTTHTLTLGSTNLEKLTDEEIEIIEMKGWNYQ